MQIDELIVHQVLRSEQLKMREIITKSEGSRKVAKCKTKKLLWGVPLKA